LSPGFICLLDEYGGEETDISYPGIIKEAALKKMFHTDLSLRQISDELSIPRATLHCWKKQYSMINNDSKAINTPAENFDTPIDYTMTFETTVVIPPNSDVGTDSVLTGTSAIARDITAQVQLL
jgi:hypothetical protein